MSEEYTLLTYAASFHRMEAHHARKVGDVLAAAHHTKKAEYYATALHKVRRAA